MRCYTADFRLYSIVYSLLNSPWVVKKAFFGLYRPFLVYIPPSIAKKGGMFLKRRWYVTKVVYSLIGVYDIPEPCELGRAGGQGPEAPALPASLSLGLDWIVTSRMPPLGHWTGYKRDCEHNGRQQPCTLGSMWLHAWTARTDTPCIHTDRLEHWLCQSPSQD